MIRYLFGDALARHPRLRDSLYRDRAAQFAHRRGWPLQLDAEGREIDQYDALNPLHVIWQRPDGSHGGSMRFLPTTGRTMLAEYFAHLAPAAAAGRRGVWECTRFCLSPGAGGGVAAALMSGAIEMGLALGLSRSVGVFDGRMTRIYARLGWPPRLLAETGQGPDRLCLGEWTFDPDLRGPLRRRAGLSAQALAGWVARDFGAGGRLDLAA